MDENTGISRKGTGLVKGLVARVVASGAGLVALLVLSHLYG